MKHNEQIECPCGSGRRYQVCCEPYLSGSAVAPTAEALMRSRYVAYVLRQETYLLATWHPATRPIELNLASAAEYCHLEIKDTVAGLAGDKEGWVEFAAAYDNGAEKGVLHERSRFLFEGGVWYYIDGVFPQPEAKVGRNSPCPCGSGKKYKRCCGRS